MTIKKNIVTLDEFTIADLRNYPQATGELSRLLRDIGLAAKLINAEVNKAGLVNILGDTDAVNIQGEQVKKLDVFANEQMISVLRNGVSCAGIVSEELEDPVIFDDEISSRSKYIVAFDPLDGSSNIDNGISIGTIFAIYRRKGQLGLPCTQDDFLLDTNWLIAAGYVIYGSSTILVYATKLGGVNGFTLDTTIGEFCLSHPNIQCPEEGYIYSVNYANYFHFSVNVQQYLSSLLEKNKTHENYYTHRYVGSMVADLHRNLVKGGIFLYPGTTQHPAGKLRLWYECVPLAFIFEMAGGVATDGTQSILDIPFSSIHQRSPLFIGSKAMIERLITAANVEDQ